MILVLDSFQSWNEIELTGLLNASSYFPEILNETRSEQTIRSLLEQFKQRIVEIPIR